jgi:4-carboxymuconolactone decarboxylase
MTEKNDELESTQDRRDVIGKLNELAPDFVSMISNFCLGEVYARPALTDKTKEIVAIVSLISLGSERLKGHLESALAQGVTKEELSEVIMLSSIYLGFPRAIDAMLVLHNALNENDDSKSELQ